MAPVSAPSEIPARPSRRQRRSMGRTAGLPQNTQDGISGHLVVDTPCHETAGPASEIRSSVRENVTSPPDETAPAAEVEETAEGPTRAMSELVTSLVPSDFIVTIPPPKFSWWRKLLGLGPNSDSRVKYKGTYTYAPLIEQLRGHSYGRARDPALRKLLVREAMRWCKLHHVETTVIPGSVAAAMVPDDVEMHALRFEQESANAHKKAWLSKNLA